MYNFLINIINHLKIIPVKINKKIIKIIKDLQNNAKYKIYGLML